MIQFSKFGLSYDYYGDKLTRKWPWRKEPTYFSDRFGKSFNTIPEYWEYLNNIDKMTSKNRVLSFSDYEAVYAWVSARMPRDIVVVLARINLEAKPAKFWREIPEKTAIKFWNDFVVLVCRDALEARDLINSTPESFADAYMFIQGSLTTTNKRVL